MHIYLSSGERGGGGGGIAFGGLAFDHIQVHLDKTKSHWYGHAGWLFELKLVWKAKYTSDNSICIKFSARTLQSQQQKAYPTPRSRTPGKIHV